LEPGSRLELLFLDESEIHLHPHLVRMWMPKSERFEVPAPGTNRKIPIFAALNYGSNRLSYHIGQGKNATEFLGFLAQLAQEHHHRHGLMVLDNASYHTAAVVQKYLAELASTFQVIWLPPYCPELNDIEHVWKYVKAASLANYDFGQATNLRSAIVEVFAELNNGVHDNLTLSFRDPLSKELLQVA